ncbi:MAG: hypothetical protein ACI4UA_04890, partial [Bacteroidaceae bacterium]
MKKVAVILLLLASAVISQAQETVMRVTLGGGLETEGCELSISAYAAGWLSLSVHGDWNAPRQDERQFQLLSDGQKTFEGKSRYVQKGDSIMAEIQLTCTRQVAMQSLSVALNIPLNRNRGGVWKTDALGHEIPTGKSQDGSLHSCQVPLPSG